MCHKNPKISKTDKLNFVFPDVHSQEECKVAGTTAGVNTIWSNNTINRKDKFSRGSCYYSKSDQVCGDQMHPMYLTSKDIIKNDDDKEQRKSAFVKSKLSCKANIGRQCEFVKLKRGHDCVYMNKHKKNLLKPEKKTGNRENDGPVNKPPAAMPKDPTDPNANIQDYLYNWYNNKTGNKAPDTGSLSKATGNQCIKQPMVTKSISGNNDGKIFKKGERYKLKDLKKITFPVDEHHKRILKDAIGTNMLTKLQDEYTVKYEDAKKELMEEKGSDWKNKTDTELYRLFQKEIPPMNMENSVVWDEVKEPYRTFNNDEAFEEEIPEKTQPDNDALENKKKPSIPQSLINMMLKKIAEDRNNTAKGMLALHSTGSGKTFTSAGVIDAFWNTNRQILFISSIDAIASNPPYKFHEGLKELFPDFSKYTQDQISHMFVERGVTFLSFAKAAKRLKKTQLLFHYLGIDPIKDLNIDGVFKANPKEYIKSMYNNNNNNKNIKDKDIKDALNKAKINNWTDIVDIDNAIIIVDEVQNLFRPLAHQKADHNYIESHFIGKKMVVGKSLDGGAQTRAAASPAKKRGAKARPHVDDEELDKQMKSSKNASGFKENYVHNGMKIVILSATPGDNPDDILKLLNIIRNPTRPELKHIDVDDPMAVRQFKIDISGLISYFDMSNDPGKFPRLIDPGPVRVPMSTRQLKDYIEKYKENAKQKDNIDYDKLAKDKQLAKFWKKARSYSNMLYNVADLPPEEYSAKMPLLLENIDKYADEKHYVYSAFYENKGSGQGILQIERELQRKGYEKLTIKQAKAVNKGAKLEPKPRYMMATLRELEKESPTQQGNALAEMIKIYNSAENKDGSLVHVMLASNAFNEGLDLKAVRHIHIFEPLVTMASDKQTIGRARRYCSHADLDYDKWSVVIHRYMSDMPISMEISDFERYKTELEVAESKLGELTNTKTGRGRKLSEEDKLIRAEAASLKKEITELKKMVKQSKTMDLSEIKNIDEVIYNIALNRFKKLTVYMQCMKEAAVDCKLLSEFHNDPTVRCGINGPVANKTVGKSTYF
jgi:hypothetical protein